MLRSDLWIAQTRWGVGFGPRDCSDYQTGVSVIPIDRLTEADQRWMVSAEYGGTGGQPLQGGMCVEEPDIEIGQGVSSKGTFANPPILPLYICTWPQATVVKAVLPYANPNSLPQFYTESTPATYSICVPRLTQTFLSSH